MRVCEKCGIGQPLDDEHFYRHTCGYRYECKACSIVRTSANTKAERQVDKLAVFAYYGDKCFCCGESHPRFLTIDHIGGGGNKHRGQISGRNIYRFLRRNDFPEGYRVSCWNCNSGRHLNGGVCPHQEQCVTLY